MPPRDDYSSGAYGTVGLRQTASEEMQKLLKKAEADYAKATTFYSIDESLIKELYTTYPQLLQTIHSLQAQCSTLQSENEQLKHPRSGRSVIERLKQQVAILQEENKKLQFKYDTIREWAAERDKDKDDKIATLQSQKERAVKIIEKTHCRCDLARVCKRCAFLDSILPPSK